MQIDSSFSQILSIAILDEGFLGLHVGAGTVYAVVCKTEHDGRISLKKEVCKDFHMDEDLEVVKGVQMTIRTTKR
jgi:hypothetical protein